MGRKILNTGQVSVPKSGDTIHAGGEKIKDNFDELYKTFGDQRLVSTVKNNSEYWIRPHATGYFQHKTLSSYASSVESGSMHDIDSTLSSGNFPVRLPVIGKQNGQAKRGERIMIQDTVGSFGTVPVYIYPSSGQAITGANSNGGYYILAEDRLRATLVVVNDDVGSERWEVKVESVSGTDAVSISKTVEVQYNETVRMDLHARTSYNAVKLLVYAEQIKNADNQIDDRSAFEIQIMHSETDVYSTVYSVINQVSEAMEPLANLTPVIYQNSNGDDIIALDIQSNSDSDHKIRVTIQATGSVQQKL